MLKAPQSHESGAFQALLSIGNLPPERGSVVTSAVSIYVTGVSIILTPVIFSFLSTIVGPSTRALLFLVVRFLVCMIEYSEKKIVFLVYNLRHLESPKVNRG